MTLAAVHRSNPCAELIDCIRAYRERPHDESRRLDFEANVQMMVDRLQEFERVTPGWLRPNEDEIRSRLFRFYDATQDNQDLDRQEGLFNATFWSLTPEFYGTIDEATWSMLTHMDGASFASMRSWALMSSRNFWPQQEETPFIVITTTGFQSDCFISLQQSSELIEQTETLLRKLKTYRSGLVEWEEQMDLFRGSELPAKIRHLGFRGPRPS